MSENDETLAPALPPDPEDLARLRAAFADWSVDENSSGEEGEIDAARIFDAVQGDLSPEERLAVIEQMANDPDAALAWRLAADLAPPAEERQPAQEVDRSLAPVVPLIRPDRRVRHEIAAREAVWGESPRWRWAAAAAASVLVLMTIGLFQLRTTGDPVYRGEGGSVVESALARGAKLPRENARLRWKEIVGATYRVQVFAEDLTILTVEEDLRVPEFLIPPEALRAVPRGGRVSWKVEAVVPGEGKRTSRTFSVVIE